MPFRKTSSWGAVKPPQGARLSGPSGLHPLMCFLLNEKAATVRNIGNAVLSTDGYAGTVTAPNWEAGKFGPCLTFASGSYVTPGLSNSLSFEKTQPFSLCAWVKTTSSADQGVISKWSVAAGVPSGWFMRVYLGVVNLQFQSSSANYKVARGDITLNDGKWHFIVATNDGSGTVAGMKIYVDARRDPAATPAEGGTLGSIVSVYRPGIGVQNRDDPLAGNAGPFVGQIDLPRVYKRELRQTEILRLYNDPFGDIAAPRRRISGPVAMTSNIKTMDTLARASIKMMHGVAIASVKAWNGIA